MSFLGLSTVSSWKHHIFVHIPSDGIILSQIIAYFLKNWPVLNRNKNVFSNRSLIRFLSLICPLPSFGVIINLPPPLSFCVNTNNKKLTTYCSRVQRECILKLERYGLKSHLYYILILCDAKQSI